MPTPLRHALPLLALNGAFALAAGPDITAHSQPPGTHLGASQRFAGTDSSRDRSSASTLLPPEPDSRSAKRREPRDGNNAGNSLPGQNSLGRIEPLDPRLAALIPPTALIELVADGLLWAEGPLWDTRNGVLLFSDVPRNAVFSVRPGGPVTTLIDRSGYSGSQEFAGREPGSNGLTFDAGGRLLLCQHGDRRIVRREDDGRFTVLAERYQGKRLNSPNDLVLRSNGDLYFTDPPYGLPGVFNDPGKELEFQGVYRLAPDGSLTALVTDLRAPNGIALSPDEQTLYVSNAQSTRPIWMAYPLRGDGTVGPGRQFAEASAFVRPRDGVPDGMKVDERGNVFATGPGGVHVFAPNGTRLGRIDTGVPTANVAWGEDGSVLYIAANNRILRVKTTTRGRLPAARMQ